MSGFGNDAATCQISSRTVLGPSLNRPGQRIETGHSGSPTSARIAAQTCGHWSPEHRHDVVISQGIDNRCRWRPVLVVEECVELGRDGSNFLGVDPRKRHRLRQIRAGPVDGANQPFRGAPRRRHDAVERVVVSASSRELHIGRETNVVQLEPRSDVLEKQTGDDWDGNIEEIIDCPGLPAPGCACATRNLASLPSPAARCPHVARRNRSTPRRAAHAESMTDQDVEGGRQQCVRNSRGLSKPRRPSKRSSTVWTRRSTPRGARDATRTCDRRGERWPCKDEDLGCRVTYALRSARRVSRSLTASARG